MVKTLLSLLLLILTQGAFASDKAFTVLLNYKFSETELLSIVDKYPELKDIDVASESYKMDIEEFNPSNFSLKLYSEKTNEAYIITKTSPGVDVKKMDVMFEIETRSIDGDIRNTLYETVFKETDSEELAQTMAEAFKEDFTTTKGLRTTSLYSFQVQQYFDDGRFVKYGNVLSASLIIGHAISKKIYKLDPNTFTWSLVPENYSSSEKPFYEPVKASRVSSLFQLNRRNPVTRRHQPHNGIDFVAASGSPIFPALDGEITVVGRTRSKGKYITILHDNGYQTTYMHLKNFQKGLRVGMRVELEDQIGEVGRTGYSTGAHLHFGVIYDGYFVNPLYLLKSYGHSQKDEHENLDEIEVEEPEEAI